jgi:hypothetical protein
MLCSQRNQLKLSLKYCKVISPGTVSRPLSASIVRRTKSSSRSDASKVLLVASDNESSALAMTELANELMRVTEGQRWGVNLSAVHVEKAKKLVAELQALNDDVGQRTLRSSATSGESLGTVDASWMLNGDWELLFTTESSVHALVKGLFFGLGVQTIRQIVDLRSLRVSNRIEFESFGFAIQARAPAKIVGRNKISYAFDEVIIEIPHFMRFSLPFYPKGSGWTEAIYADKGLRVMRNSLGDTLLFRASRTL